MKNLFVMANWLAAFGMFMVSCAPTAAPAATPAVTPPSKPESSATKAPPAPSPTLKPASNEPQSGGTPNVSHFADPASFDPIQEATLQAGSLVAPNYSNIVQHDPLEPTKVIGDLAEKWDLSQDGKTYTFSLNKGVKWHDGKPFTSEDARFSLELTRQPPRGIVSPKRTCSKQSATYKPPIPAPSRSACPIPALPSFITWVTDAC